MKETELVLTPVVRSNLCYVLQLMIAGINPCCFWLPFWCIWD